MKTFLRSFLILSILATVTPNAARAGTLLCGAAAKAVVFRISYATGNPGSVQIMAAYTRISLMNKSEMRGEHYWGRGHAPRIRSVDVGPKFVKVNARGGMMGPGGTLSLPTDILYGRSKAGLEASATLPASYYSKGLKREFPLACKLFDQ